MTMPAEKTYYIYQQPHTYAETKTFIENYRQSIQRSFDRYVGMLPHIPRQAYVLDYGCGWGTFSEMIHQQRECQVQGIDTEAQSIEIARDFVGEKAGLSFAVQAITDLPAATFDVVVSTQVAEHTLNPGNYLYQCNRVLKPGGYLIISVPNILTPRYFISILGGERGDRFRKIAQTARDRRDRTRDHVQAWDPTTFCRLLSCVGFDYETHEFMEGVALPWGRYWRRPWGRFKHWSYTMMFKARKLELVEVSPYE